MEPIQVKVEQDNEGCAIWIIAIVLVWMAWMLHTIKEQRLQPVPQQPAIEQQHQEQPNDGPAA